MCAGLIRVFMDNLKRILGDDIIIGSEEECERSTAFVHFKRGVDHVREDYERAKLILSAGPFNVEPTEDMLNQLKVQVIRKNEALIRQLGRMYREYNLSKYYEQGEEQ